MKSLAALLGSPGTAGSIVCLELMTPLDLPFRGSPPTLTFFSSSHVGYPAKRQDGVVLPGEFEGLNNYLYFSVSLNNVSGLNSFLLPA